MTDHYQLALFHRTLAELCRSEVPLGRAFRILEQDLSRGRLRDAAGALAAEVEKGTSLSEAYRRQGAAFPPLYAAIVEAGVASGDLPGTLEEIARVALLKAEVTTRIRRAAIYPMVVVAFATVLLWFLLNYIVPQFGSIFSQIVDRRGNPLELPGITKFVLSMPTLFPFTLVVGAGLFVAVGYLRDPVDGIRLPLGASLRLPYLGPLRVNAALASFTATLAVLLRRGLPLDRALDLMAAAADGPVSRKAAESMARSARAGAGLADAARESGFLPPSMLWLLGSAERQGSPALALEDISAVCRDRVVRQMDALGLFFGPAVEFGLGVLVGTIVLAMFYPILKLQSALM